ncbi:MAG: hypothetical protein FWE16_03545 [Firmicutes bacterium]|nr:hypothetical protein [Bacillota bacterium]
MELIGLYIVLGVIAVTFIFMVLRQRRGRINPKNRVETHAVVMSCTYQGTNHATRHTQLTHHYFITLQVHNFENPVQVEAIVRGRSNMFNVATTTGEQMMPFESGQTINIAYDSVNTQKFEIMDKRIWNTVRRPG